MEKTAARSLSFSESENELKIEATKSVIEESDSPAECARPETPSSDASTSGVCSMASSDLESSEENIEEKPEVQEEQPVKRPVIIYENRNILNVFENIYPYSVFQTTYVPKMNMSNYWEKRSVYHRLGPYGRLDELDFQKCFLCDFYTTVPKRL